MLGTATLLQLAGAAALTWSTPALAIDDDPPGEQEPSPCLQQVRASFSASPSTVTLGQSTTLRWSVTGCPSATKKITGVPGTVAATGSQVITPKANGTWTLTVRLGGASRSWSVPVKVLLPKDEHGRINVTITSSDQVATFVQAISSEESTNAVVHIQNHVSLDLSHRENIHLYPGVQILGGRTAKDPGPLLFTTTYPSRLFVIGDYLDTDNVRISGIRLQGADQSVAEESSPSSVGISVNSSLNVEIDNSDLSGWHVAALVVKDLRERISKNNGVGAVRIHDNAIHDNQRIGEGYGVEVGDGAYALIERNMFNNNRHAIAGDGEHGTGYFAYRNFVGSGGGQHEVIFGIDVQTHQIDMHGQDDCWGADGYCGIAGQYMDVRYNAIHYTAGLGILLRGSPTDGMEVTRNAFAHTDEWGHFFWDRGAAMAQSDSVPGYGGLDHWDNTFGARMTGFGSICDFDGDGNNDTFSADGANWWYSVGGAVNGFNGYRYLNASTLGASELDFGDFDRDGKCDVRVKADGRISSGGTAPLARSQTTDILLRNAAREVRIVHMENGVISGQTDTDAIPPNARVLGTGDFDGDGDSDILWEETQVTSGRVVISFLQDGLIVDELNPGYVAPGTALQGIADFDGDRASDVLWRLPDGSLEMWLRPKAAGDVGYHATPSWRNQGGVVGPDWQVKAVGDFNGDGYGDIAWRHDNGQVSVWLMVGSIYTGEFYPGGQNPGLTWTIQGVGDFNGDGKSDLLWRYVDGALAIWFSGSDWGAGYPTWQNIPGSNPGLEWQVQGVSDFNQDGRSDLLWRRTDGLGAIWLMNGASHAGEPPTHTIDASWQTQGLLPRQ
ncbi:FG-GAP-like repeat-containing protein [Sorangium sp. So ce131]|uniref:FG-GAP-like repeat-containing protein n=1 Tax=Sorangium sp. So ce131 TaxID=3133282 RepID=UPI003F61973A